MQSPVLRVVPQLVAALMLLSARPATAEEWSLPADPGAADVPAPQRDTRWLLPFAPQFVICPQHPSDFVWLVSRDTEHSIWSLSAGKSAGKVSIRLQGAKPETMALSRDGTLAATSVDFSSGAVDVWNTRTGKLLHRLNPGAEVRDVEFVAFAGTDRLITYPGQTGETSIAVWNLKTGDAEKPVFAPDDLADGVVAVSPGGRYLAVAVQHKNLLCLYDVSTRQMLQQITFAKGSGGFWDDCYGLAFSPDGRELAGLFGGEPSHLRVWSLSSGEVVVDASIAADPHAGLHGKPSYMGTKFAWVPDGSGWLCHGYYWVDRSQLKVVREFELPGVQLSPTIQPLAADLVLHCGGNFRAGVLRTSVLADLPTAAGGASRPLLRTGDKVAIRVKSEGVRHVEAKDAEQVYRDALALRIEQLGFVAAEEGQVTLDVRYRESEGKLIPRPAPRSIMFPFGPPPGLPGAPKVDDKEARQGTGFVISPEGHIATCAHVCGKLKEMSIQIGDRKLKAKVLATDEKSDLAILKFDGRDEPFLPLRNSDEFELGEDVRVIGYPLSDLLGESLKVTKGTISGIVKRDGEKLFMTDATVNPGNSGGPLIDQQGRVLGVNAKMLVGMEVDNVGLSVPVNRLQPLCSTAGVTLPAVESVAGPLTGAKLLERLEATVAMIRSSRSGDSEGSLGEAHATDIEAELTLRAAGRDEPLWSHTIKEEHGAIIVRGDWNDANLRKSAVDGALRRLDQLSLPSYISADGTQRIPQVVTLKAAP